MAILKEGKVRQGVGRFIYFLRAAVEGGLQRQNVLGAGRWRRGIGTLSARALSAGTTAAASATWPRGCWADAFDPQQSRRFIHAPLQIARAVGRGRSLSIVAGDGIGRAAAASASAEREAGDVVDDFAGAVPNVDLRGELRGLMQVRERAVNAGDEEEIAVGRGPHGADDGRLADGRRPAGDGIDQHEL